MPQSTPSYLRQPETDVTRKKYAPARHVDPQDTGYAAQPARSLAWPDPDQALLEPDEDGWQDAQTVDLVAREHGQLQDWE